MSLWLKLTSTINSISRIAVIFGALCGVAIMVLFTADIVLRNAGWYSIRGVDGLVETLLVAMVFFGMAEVERKRSHIAFGMVTDRLSPRASSCVQAVGMALATLLVAWIAWLAFGQAWDAYTSGQFRHGDVRIVWWPAKSALAVGALFLVCEMVLTVAGLVRHAVSGKSEFLPLVESDELGI